MTLIKKLLSSTYLSRYLKITMLFGDLTLLNGIYLLSVLFKYSDLSWFWKNEIFSILIISNLTWMFLIKYYEAYSIIRVDHIEKTIIKTIKLLFIHMCFIALVIVFFKYKDISRSRILFFYVFFSLSLLVFRIVFIRFLKYIRSYGINNRLVIIVGVNKVGNRIAKILSKDLSYGYKILGFFDDLSKESRMIGKEYLGKLNDIENYLKNNEVHEMYISLHFSESSHITQLIHLGDKYMVRIKFAPNFQEYTKSRKVSIDFYENIPILMFRKEPLSIPLNSIVKRLFDIFFSVFVIILIFSWLFPVLAIIIKLSSPGSVFYKQKRSGENKTTFTCFKFRSMRVNNGAFIQATKDDPRVTKIGKFLRKTSMDELPQFFNVLLGYMTIVGPRPHPIELDKQYNQLIDNYLVRHYVKPGITGWAQINGYRGETKELADMQHRIEYDIWYVENWSFLLDIKIIVNTVFKVLKGDKKAM